MDVRKFLKIGRINGEKADERENTPPELRPMVLYRYSKPLPLEKAGKKDASYQLTQPSACTYQVR